ncbi:MAG: cytochrome c, partial [Gammaproteobacteria bacterium]|nr:cytochrome c [Gammaproteobacteria bacterium]
RARSRPRLLAFALDGSAPAPPWAEMRHFAAPPEPRPDTALASAGNDLFEAYGCMTCHGPEGVAVVAELDLRTRLPGSVEYLQTVLGGALAARGMPAFEMTDEGAEALRAYLINRAWDAHEAQEAASEP